MHLVTHHHWSWRLFRSSCRKLARVILKPTITEFCSDALTDWANFVGYHIYRNRNLHEHGTHHHWRVFRSSCSKLARVGFEPTKPELNLVTLEDWALRPLVWLALRANSVQLIQVRLLFSVQIYLCHCLRRSLRLAQLKSRTGNHDFPT